MARYQHEVTGCIISVDDDFQVNGAWQPIAEDTEDTEVIDPADPADPADSDDSGKSGKSKKGE